MCISFVCHKRFIVFEGLTARCETRGFFYLCPDFMSLFIYVLDDSRPLRNVRVLFMTDREICPTNDFLSFDGRIYIPGNLNVL